MVLIIILKGGFPSISGDFIKLMLSASLIDLVAFFMAIEGIRRSNISIVSPMAAFSPVFTTIIAVFTLNEIPSVYGLLGILIVVIGAYTLNVSEIKDGFFEPVRKLIHDKGVMLFLGANLLWAITPIFQKKAIFETDPALPLMASFAGYIFVSLYLSPYIITRFKNVKKAINNHFYLFIILGIFGAISQFAAYEAFSLANVGYVTTLFRLSGIFGVIAGVLILKEGNLKGKLTGAIIMLIGTILVTS